MRSARKALVMASDPLAEARTFFHLLWSKARACDDYEKEDWLRLEALLHQLGLPI
ncbi:MAG TPA: inositol oxygenase family protein [Gemmatimonadaceae bacterium]|nr:inositol oxygenase family protein [Gemmatimonadaceae bacterium]